MSHPDSVVEEAPWRVGLHSARATALPGLVLITAAGLVVAAYYFSPPVHAALEAFAAFRIRGGFLYSALTTAFFAGLIPFLYLHFHPGTVARHPWPHVIFFVVFWGYKGVEIDLLYRVQALLFGDQVDWLTITKKMLVDQLIYNPFIAAPYGLLLYAWKDAGFRWAAPLADFRAPRWFWRRVLPVMIAVWGVWVPSVCLIYALPLALQLPLNSLVNTFWVILFSLITLQQNRPAEAA
ncbi:MAG: hypothetical protein Q8J74_08145 [Candidatus Didemnitutus sp.]|nr:hypothetical protein [Candidatus Didemnitutus sp.]